MSQLPQISLNDTTQFLREKYGRNISRVRQIGAGAWSQAFAFTVNGVAQVIRWSRFADNFERDAFAMHVLHPDLPMPEMLERGRYGEHYYAVSRFVSGAYLEQLPAPELSRTLPSLLRMLRALRVVDLTPTFGFGIWDGDGNAPHQSWRSFLLDDKNDSKGSLIKGWRQNLEASPWGAEVFDRLWIKFERLAEDCPDQRQLVHSDLINGNVLVANGEIAAVLDWGSSIIGDALYDSAWFVFYQPWYPQFVEVDLTQRLLHDFRADPNASTTDLEARLRCYLMHIGLDSIAYNAFQQNWANAKEAAEYTATLTEETATIASLLT